MRFGSDRTLVVDGRVIDDASDCYVIAEIGHNHQGSLEQAMSLFTEAARCGADAVKLQKRHNRSLFSRELFDAPYENENSFGATYGEHREALEFGKDEYVALQRHARDLGITFFATAFDQASADFLAELDMPAYKIASGDLTNLPLLRHVGAIGRPVIVSTGGAHLEDVQRAVAAITAVNRDVAILQCTAGYPCDWDQLDLRVIETYRGLFPDHVVGFSGHDNGIAMSTVAYALGARIVEKHFTLSRAARGTDHAFSLEPQGLQKLVRDLRRARVALGDGNKRQYDSEVAPLRKMGKQLVAARDLPAGHVLDHADIAARSPATDNGLAPYEIDDLVGSRLREPLTQDTPFGWSQIVSLGAQADTGGLAARAAS